MTEDAQDRIDAILGSLLPEAQACIPGGQPYNPKHCLAIYQPRTEPSMEFPAILVGQSALAPYGVGVSLLQGLPAVPPRGCIIIGTWEQLYDTYARYLDGFKRPAGRDDYLLRIDGFVLLVGAARAGCIMGAQTLIQIVSLATDRRIPGMTVVDAPAIPIRSCAYDLRAQIPHNEHLMRAAGFSASFKANRLHLWLDAVRPLADQPGLGCMRRQDAREIASICGEYAVDIVPWCDLLPRLSNPNHDFSRMIEQAAELAQTFQAPALGLGGRLEPGSDPERPRRFIGLLLRETEAEVYLPAQTLAALYGEAELPARLVGWFDRDEAVANYLPLLSRNSHPAALQADFPNTGYVPPRPREGYRRIDDGIAAATRDKQREICFYGGDQRHGNLWDNSLVPAIGCLAAAWKRSLDAHEASARFARLAYGKPGETLMTLLDEVAGLFPPLLRGVDGERLRLLAFGYAGSAEEWQALAEVDWTLVNQKLRAVETTIQHCRDEINRNAETIDTLDLGVSALWFLAVQTILFGHAVTYYRRALQEGRDWLAPAGESVRAVVEKAAPLVRALETIADRTGACAQEMLQLKRHCAELSRLSTQLTNLQHSSDTLPPMEDLGLPPVPARDPELD